MCLASLSQVAHLWNSITVPTEFSMQMRLRATKRGSWSLDGCRQELRLCPQEPQFLYLLNEREHKGVLLVWHRLSHWSDIKHQLHTKT